MGYTKEQRIANEKKKELEAKNEQEQKQQKPKQTDPAPTSNNEIKVRKTKKKLPLDMIVEVKNGFNGKLIYVSKRTIGYTVIFEEFGDLDYITLDELVSASNASRKFFENNWFLIDYEEVLDFLNVSRFYKNALNTENFDEIFNKTENEILETVKKLSSGQKNTLIYRAKQKIETGEIDSRKTIEILEKALEVELIER